MSWWKFWGKKREQTEAERQFQSQLNEALLRQDDLKDLAQQMKEDRMKRHVSTQSGVTPRAKLNSQTSS